MGELEILELLEDKVALGMAVQDRVAQDKVDLDKVEQDRFVDMVELDMVEVELLCKCNIDNYAYQLHCKEEEFQEL